MNRIEFARAPLSKCIRVALSDLDRCERDPRYNVDMGLWHVAPSRFSVPSTCAVCFAGSVMAQTFNMNHLMSFEPGDFSKEQATRFRALDLVRTGAVRTALTEMGYTEFPTELTQGSITDPPLYHLDPEGFKRHMGHIATLLESHNL